MTRSAAREEFLRFDAWLARHEQERNRILQALREENQRMKDIVAMERENRKIRKATA